MDYRCSCAGSGHAGLSRSVVDRPHDRDDLEERRKPTIQLDEEQAIAVRELDPTAHLTLKRDHPTSERGILSLKLADRPERLQPKASKRQSVKHRGDIEKYGVLEPLRQHFTTQKKLPGVSRARPAAFLSGDCPAQSLRTGTDLRCSPMRNEKESWPAIHNLRPIPGHAAMCEGSQFSPAVSRKADAIPGLPQRRACEYQTRFLKSDGVRTPSLIRKRRSASVDQLVQSTRPPTVGAPASRLSFVSPSSVRLPSVGLPQRQLARASMRAVEFVHLSNCVILPIRP